MPTEVISTVLPDGSKKIDLKSGLNLLEKITASQLIKKKPWKPRQKMKQKFLEKYVYFWPIMMFLSLIRFGLKPLKSNLNANVHEHRVGNALVLKTLVSALVPQCPKSQCRHWKKALVLRKFWNGTGQWFSVPSVPNDDFLYKITIFWKN